MEETEKKEEKKWYSMGCTSPKKELRVRDDARKYGLAMEDFCRA